MHSIKFGTSGWRALYHQDFTFDNVATVIQAIAEEVNAGGNGARGVAVGYDVRFMGRQFAELTCGILAANGIKAFLTNRDVPTPTLSFAIIDRKLAGGINFTASHNPFEYNGVKFSPESGGPALPKTTKRIEARIAEIQADRSRVRRMDIDEAKRAGLFEEIDPLPPYFGQLKRRLALDTFTRLKGKRIAVDAKHAVARGYLDRFLQEAGVEVHVIHGEADPYFGFDHPEPAGGHVNELQGYVRAHDDVVLGLACDGDADRFGIVDSDGAYVEANVVAAVLLHYLVGARGWKGGVARSVATTHLVDKVAGLHGLKLYETPVGFKFIGDLLVRGEIVFGAEESAGLTVEGHLPEKDGILACLLVAEMVAATGKSVRQLTEELFSSTGVILDKRSAVRLTAEMEQTFDGKIAVPPADVGGRKVERVDKTDGTKLLLEGGEWILLRKSGTEPVVRLYAEAQTEERIETLMQACETWLRG
jgi:alpha-D-glucose phosphate-specific phosphoglucomutase